ncbi:acyltransferase [Carnobacterium maltaromaticum]|uniref:acyltransferase family protein n=1 Tax=Carnobacterium maltaromaticum TaxID=2751 RepID=UPI00295E48B8|nr:acyltransferase [Carnobacterium maltaromaticum]
MQFTTIKEQKIWIHTKRIHYLDSIRGIASVTVVFAHLASVYAEETFFKTSVQSLGRSAVILFFLLSGLSLSISLMKRPTAQFGLREYIAYLVKRFTRIYTPFLIVLLLSEFLFLLIQPEKIAGVSDQFNKIGTITNWSLFSENMFMTGNNVSLLNPVIWSLIIEIRLSILFPFLFFFVSYWRIPAFIFLLIASFMLGTILLYALGNQFLIGQTFFHTGFFTLGIGLSLFWNQLNKIPKKWLFPLIFISCLLYFHVIFLVLFKIKNVQFISDIVIGIGSTGILIVCTQSKSIQRFLTYVVYLQLGKISFSLYLVHSVVLILMLRILSPFLSIIVIELISIPIIFSISYFCYLIIENPTKLIGQYLR